MPSKKFLCLAKSRKNGQWCVAGLDESGYWIRLVNRGGGELSNSDITDQNGNQPEVLETWIVQVVKAEPLYYQPENWIINDKRYWKYTEEPIYAGLEELCDDDDYIFLNTSDRLSTFKLMIEPISQSLMLIYVDKIVFQKTTNASNRIQVRAKFKYKNKSYDLVVTDPEWEKKFRGPNSECPDFGDYLFDEGYYLTIGLGEEWNGYHYKLVVAVIPSDIADDAADEWESFFED